MLVAFGRMTLYFAQSTVTIIEYLFVVLVTVWASALKDPYAVLVPDGTTVRVFSVHVGAPIINLLSRVIWVRESITGNDVSRNSGIHL